MEAVPAVFYKTSLSFYYRFGRAPPLKGKALVAAGAFLRIYPRGVKRQLIRLGNFVIYHNCFLGALRHAQPALKAFICVYFIYHFILQSLFA
jgi:hypothetical protein